MSENEDKSSVWQTYVEAKKHAASDSKQTGDKLTIAELEAAIAEEAALSGLSETGMPPRAVIHLPKRSQLSRWFYLTLVILFTLLVAGLFWWGRKAHGG
ncbi:hypothetical protein [Cohnella yongneupensis]|uniref:Uncharacterized protein n=1 Tax=Cohnella yongneupensis TaxID=425006 RepID=A0ABW0R5Z5_9BACL